MQTHLVQNGEFRHDLDKYLTLRKRLKIPAKNLIVLASDLDDCIDSIFE